MYSCPVYILKKYTVSVPIILIHHIWFWPIVLYYVAMAQCSNNVMISFQKIFWQKTIMIFPMVFSILCIVFLWRLLGGLYTNRSLLLKKILEFISTFFYLQVRKSKKMIDLNPHFYPNTARPRDTRPLGAWALQIHDFELVPKSLEKNCRK